MQAGDVQEILPLEKARFAIPVLKAWFIEEWEPWYGLGGQGDAEADLRACCNHDRLPIALVAIGKDGQILGTAALKTKSLGSEYGYGPWLAALLVDKPCRGRGIGTLLIGAIEEQARRLGFSAIYASTDSAGSVLTRRGWSQTGDQIQSLRGPVSIYQRAL